MARSSRNADCTPLAIIQEEVFQLRQRQKLAEAAQINARPGPPPDMAQFAAVYKPQHASHYASHNASHYASQHAPQQPFAATQQQPSTPTTTTYTPQQTDEDVPPKKKKSKPVVVTPTEFYPEDFNPAPIQTRRLRNETLVRYQLFIVLTLIVFLCLYVYPVVQKTPNDRRMSALKTLAIASVISLVCTWLILSVFTKVDA
jgi:hypothetical protein